MKFNGSLMYNGERATTTAKGQRSDFSENCFTCPTSTRNFGFDGGAGTGKFHPACFESHFGA
jgi:hypothetical protein